MDDLRNLKKAFELLDKDKSGVIRYDIKKIPESKFVNNKVEKFTGEIDNENDEAILNLEQFIDIMTYNILNFRKKYSDRVVFESGKLTIKFRNIKCILFNLHAKISEILIKYII
jgi:Ca2+-binding EF-hand superfamily protein